MHHRTGVAVGMLTDGDGDRRKLLSRPAELVEVALREQGDLVDGTEQSERPRPLVLVADPVAHL